MKKELLTLVAGSAMFASFASAEIVLTDDLSAYGYIDTAYTSGNDQSDLNGSVAEFELGFAFTPVESPFSAVAELSFDDGDVNDSYDFETVTISYAYSDELSFTVGNILSYQGFETYDATGLYQYSYQGIAHDIANGIANGVAYSAGYAYGVAADYATDTYALGLWVGEGSGDEISFEYFAQYTGVEGLTLTAVVADDGSYDTTNLWASYEVDAFTFAVEYTNTDYIADVADDEIYMALVYYSFGDAGLTVRYSTGEDTGVDFDRYTISPSYAFSDNVFGLVEYSYDDVAGGNNQLAAELIFSF